uniref:hypothetical protein n=1 Tax=Nonomuraea sp. CA-251285 TaxID=3240002 RepID=UPI003F4918FD
MSTNDPHDLRHYGNQVERNRQLLMEALSETRKALDALEAAYFGDATPGRDFLDDQSEKLTSAAGRVAIHAGGLDMLRILSDLVDDGSTDTAEAERGREEA